MKAQLYNCVDLLALLKGQYSCVRVIPDVHGHADRYNHLVESAINQRIFVVQLGDIIDRGPDSPECIMITDRMINNKRGVMIRGNHEWKMGRYLRGGPIYMGHATQVETLRQIKEHQNSLVLASTIERLDREAPFYARMGCIFFSHAAFHADMNDMKTHQRMHGTAVYGSSDGKNEYGFGIRTNTWMNDVPTETVVVIGHRILSKETPTLVQLLNGSLVLFMDTGCGIGGPLSYIDIDVNKAHNFATIATTLKNTFDIIKYEDFEMRDKSERPTQEVIKE